MERDSTCAKVVVPMAIVTSLGLNIAALSVPFMTLKTPMKKEPGIYSIPNTVRLTWHHKLYFISILICAWSMVFPFLKLIGLSVIWFVKPRTIEFREKCLRWLAKLSRWSLLDVYFCLIMIVLTHDQGKNLTVEVRAGLPLFCVAILINMAITEVMLQLHKGEEVAQNQPTKCNKIALILLLIASTCALLPAIFLNYMGINMMFLKNNSYGILSTIDVLWTQGKVPLLILVGAFLIVMPLAWIIGTFVLLFKDKVSSTERRIVEIFRNLSMIDVFALAVGLFLIEGKHIIKVEAKAAMSLMIVTIIINSVIAVIASCASKEKSEYEPVNQDDKTV